MTIASAPQHVEPEPASVGFRAANLCLNHELSALQFNARVLAQARDATVPLLERLHFLCISVRNLDEFFEVRVASLRHWIAYGDARPGPDGMPLAWRHVIVGQSIVAGTPFNGKIMNQRVCR